MSEATKKAKEIKKSFEFDGEYDLGEVFQVIDDLVDEVEELDRKANTYRSVVEGGGATSEDLEEWE